MSTPSLHTIHIPIFVVHPTPSPASHPHPYCRTAVQEYGADVVLHFGMHGTVEWLPGAPLGNNGLSWSDGEGGRVTVVISKEDEDL